MSAARLRALPSVAPKRHGRPRGILAQVRTAAQNPASAALGALLGGLVPLAAFSLAHQAQSPTPAACALRWAVVTACLAFSAPTVYEWARLALGGRWKAGAFTALLEGVMLSGTPLGLGWLSTAALVYLVAINAVATAHRLACADGSAAL